MLIKEVLGVDIDDIVKESDEFALKSALDAIMLNVKDNILHNKNAVVTLDAVINLLNAKSDFLSIDPRDDDRRNFIMQAFEEHGMEVERGSGRITLQQMTAAKTDSEEVEKENQTKKIASKAMDKVKKDSESGGEL